MAVDRGGLRYPIEVVDKFSENLGKFTAQAKEAQAAFSSFRDAVGGRAAINTQGIQNTTRALKELAGQRKKHAESITLEEEAERRNDKIQRDAAVRAFQQKQALADNVREIKKKVGVLSVQEEAEEKVAAAIRRKAVAEEVARQATAKGIQIGRQKKQALSVEEEAEKKLEAIKRRKAVAEQVALKAAQQGIDLSRKKAVALTAEARANDIAAKAEQRRQVASILAARGLSTSGNPLQAPLGVNEQATKNLREQLRRLNIQEAEKELKRLNPQFGALAEAEARASREGNSLFFTFRRLIGVFAAFAILRNVVTGFTTLIGRAIEYNAALERAETGIAGVLTAVGRVSVGQREITDGAEAFAVAQGIAARQMRLLRADAIETAATFEELVEAFQTAIGPGLAAGLKIDEIRKFAVRMSQAAGAFGLAQNQLGEEIRSVLTGTISGRNTKIASILGITNADIRSARQAGRLAEFLEEKFKAFAISGRAALLNFDTVVSNTREALDLVIGSGATEFFEELKGLLLDINRSLIRSGAEGLEPNPKAVAAIREIVGGIRQAVDAAREFIKTLDPRDVQSIAQFIGNAFAIVGELIVGAVRGITQALGTITAVLNPVLDIFRKVLGESRATAAWLFKWGVYLATAHKLAGLSLGPFGALKTAAGALNVSALVRTLGLAIGLIGGLLVGFGLVQEKVRGNEGQVLSLGTTIQNVLLNLVRNLAPVGALIQKGFAAIPLAINGVMLAGREVFSETMLFIATKFADLIQGMLDVLKELPDSIVPDALISGLQGAADAARSMAVGFAHAGEVSGTAFDKMLQSAQRNFGEIDREAQALQDAISSVISENSDEKGGISFFDDPVGAVGQLMTKLDEAMAEAGEKAGREATGGVVEGIKAPEELKDIKEAANEGGVALGEGIKEGMAGHGITEEITNALLMDPDDQTKILNSFSDLFKNIRELFKDDPLAFVLQSLTFLGSGARPGQSGGAGPLGFAEGGKVAGRGRAALAHYTRPQGLAGGGRPRGLDPRDRIPTWSRLGEWQIRPESVSKYGDRFMAMLNAGVLDPAGVRELADSSAAVAVRAPSVPGFAHGGPVMSAHATASAPSGVILPVVVANNANLETMLNGGEQTLLRVLGRNKAKVRGLLGL